MKCVQLPAFLYFAFQAHLNVKKSQISNSYNVPWGEKKWNLNIYSINSLSHKFV